MLPRNSNHKCLKSALNRAHTFLHHSFFSAKKSLFLLIFRINPHLRSEFFDMQTLYGTLWARPTWIKRQIRNVRAKTTSKWKKRGFWSSKSLISAYFDFDFKQQLNWFWIYRSFLRRNQHLWVKVYLNQEWKYAMCAQKRRKLRILTEFSSKTLEKDYFCRLFARISRILNL